MLLCVELIHSFLWLHNIPPCDIFHNPLQPVPNLHIWVVSNLLLLQRAINILLCLHNKQYISLALLILDDVDSEFIDESKDMKEPSLQIYPIKCVS